jgi:hypothetical protein
MTNLAAEARPALATIDLRMVAAAAIVLVVFAVVPWRHHGPERVVASLDLVKRPPVIVAMELEPPPAAGLIGALAGLVWRDDPGVLPPPAHPDSQAWPHGMVIRPPAFPDRMAHDIPGTLDRTLGAALDTVLSALLGWGATTAS